MKKLNGKEIQTLEKVCDYQLNEVYLIGNKYCLIIRLNSDDYLESLFSFYKEFDSLWELEEFHKNNQVIIYYCLINNKNNSYLEVRKNFIYHERFHNYKEIKYAF